METGAADEAGPFIALGRMTDQPRRFVHDQQVGVLVDDVAKIFQAQGIVTTEGRRGTRIFDGRKTSRCGKLLAPDSP